MTDLEDAVADRLHTAARALDVPAGDLPSVVRRGDGRRRRRRRAGAVVAAVTVVAATVAATGALDRKPADVKVASGAGMGHGPVGVAWQVVQPSSGLGYAPDAGSSPPLYAVSTAPGQAAVGAEAPRVLWRSDDGVEWTAVSTVGPDLYVADLADADGRVYAVGTGPATAAPGGRPVPPLLVGWSDDGARTWRHQPLPIDLAALAARTERVGVTSTAVATDGRVTVVTGVLHAVLDVPSLLPAGVTAPDGWAFSDAGVDVLGPERAGVCPAGTSTPQEAFARIHPDQAAAVRMRPEPQAREVFPVGCLRDGADPAARPSPDTLVLSPQESRGVVASLTWAQLGIDGDLLRAVRGQPVAFVAPAGSERFERVDLPEVAATPGPALLDAGGDGFDLTLEGAASAGKAGGGIVTLHSGDGRTWSTVPSPGATVWPTAAGRVAGVQTLVGSDDEKGAVVLRRADGGWTTTAAGALLAGGVPAGSSAHVVSAAVGPFGVVAAVVVAPDRSSDPPPAVEYRVLVSRDGVTWDDRSLTELAGQPVTNVLRTAVVGERAVVAVSVPGDGPHHRQIDLVATPT